MKDLRLAMNELGFDQLVELGRAAIPGAAARWTDHNVHDPGIMLLELLAWISEAQMYSIARTRRADRRAYARLLGIEAQGPRPAEGLLWPLAGVGPKAPPPTWTARTVIRKGAVVTANQPDTSPFFTSYDVQLTTAKIVRIQTLFASGASHDWTRANEQESATFMPFGDAPAAGDRLEIACQLDPNDVPASDMPLSLGFEIVQEGQASGSSTLEIAIVDTNGERRVAFEETTAGLMRSGVFLLSVASLAPENGQFRFILRSAGGFARPPRVRLIALNAIPFTQVHEVPEVADRVGRAEPGQRYTLKQPGLLFSGSTAASLQVMVAEDGVWHEWTQTADLDQSAPTDRHFELDPALGQLTLGNGVNGRLLPRDAAIEAKYLVCSGSKGNLQPGVEWSLATLAGSFGVNREATFGGYDAQSLDELQTAARRRFLTSHPCVTSADLQNAALAYTDLGVKRAVELAPDASRPPGHRVLIAAGPRDDDSLAETVITGESRAFLRELQTRLAPRIPMGQRLQVRGPVYVPLRIRARLAAVRNADLSAVRATVMDTLRTRLALVTASGRDQWPLGRDVSAVAVKGWLRNLKEVARVFEVELSAGGKTTTLVKLATDRLPLLELDAAGIVVERSPL